MKPTNNSKAIADRLFPIRKEEIEIKDIPLEERRLHTETYDFSISTINNYLNTGIIVIPQFQRGYVWSRSQASRLIESLVIQCPIPVLYFSQTSDEKLLAIDGNQRLNSIKLYLADGFALTGLTAYPELEGYKFSELDPRFQRHILNRTLRCITILKETHPQIKFDVFERLNTGAVLLTPQELRHGIYYGSLMEQIGVLAENKTLRQLTGLNKDLRMKSEELVLRFLSLYEKYENYKFPLVAFLNSFAEKNRNPGKEKIQEYTSVFNNALINVEALFGNSAFKLIGLQSKSRALINLALYDAEMVSLARLNPSKEDINRVNKDKLILDLMKLMNQDTFYKFVTASTSNENALKYRINEMTKVLAKHLT